MSRKRRVLIGLAIVGWTGALLSQFIARRTGESAERQGWEERRNRFLLLSSLATNTLVLSTVYRYGTRIREWLQRR